jgi:hypothetical protein
LSDERLQVYHLENSRYRQGSAWLSNVGLGVTLWHGEYQGCTLEWLRWSDAEGTVIPTGLERYRRMIQREAVNECLSNPMLMLNKIRDAEGRTEKEKQERLRRDAKLRELGIDPDTL